MSEAELARAVELMTPGSGGYALDEPGYYLTHPMLLVTGVRAGADPDRATDQATDQAADRERRLGRHFQR